MVYIVYTLLHNTLSEQTAWGARRQFLIALRVVRYASIFVFFSLLISLWTRDANLIRMMHIRHPQEIYKHIRRNVLPQQRTAAWTRTGEEKKSDYMVHNTAAASAAATSQPASQHSHQTYPRLHAFDIIHLCARVHAHTGRHSGSSVRVNKYYLGTYFRESGSLVRGFSAAVVAICASENSV